MIEQTGRVQWKTVACDIFEVENPDDDRRILARVTQISHEVWKWRVHTKDGTPLKGGSARTCQAAKSECEALIV